MPCRCDYMEPTEHEIYCQKTAKLYLYALNRLVETQPGSVKDESQNVYAKKDYTANLCEILGNLRERDQAAFDQLVYNGKDKQSRKLADWWEDHEKVDRKRKEAEKKEADRKALAEAARAKLTKEELEALGVKP